MQDTTQNLATADIGWINPPLDRTSPLPLYAQIKQRLIGLILRWEQPDRRFYSDEQLCAFFCVSRDTVRQALSELVRDGMLTRSRGLGTFVSARKLEERFGPGMDFIRQWEAAGTPIQSTLLIFERCGADDQVADALKIEVGAQILFIKRTRAAARVPVAIDYRYLPADLVTDWDESSALASPLHLLWQCVELRNGEFAIEAGVAGPEEVEYLHLNAGAPVLIRTLRYRDADGRLVMAGHTVHRGDLVRYSLNVPLSREAGVAASAIGKTAVHSGVHDD
ncbi:GntR family transcriptional regulator [Bradyrhizobium sp.]|uniref:GntR family transcriptional regulator n=1 Tax=Bradyrhizobium sp. TaxID=376 RepID=UPI003C486FF2